MRAAGSVASTGLGFISCSDLQEVNRNQRDISVCWHPSEKYAVCLYRLDGTPLPSQIPSGVTDKHGQKGDRNPRFKAQ